MHTNHQITPLQASLKPKLTISLVCIILLISSQLVAQERIQITGQVIDKETNEPLPLATIIYQKNGSGTVSDKNGQFSLTLFDPVLTDMIKVSFVGFQPLEVSIREAKNMSRFELSPATRELGEILVEPKEIKLNRFAKEVIQLYNSQKRSSPHIAIAHYRESAKRDDRYIMFMESVGFSVFAGQLKGAAKLSNYKFYCENTRAYVSDPKWLAYDEFQIPKKGKIPPSGGANLNAFRYLELYGFLSWKAFKKYRYSLDSSYIQNGKEVFVVKFEGGLNEGKFHALVETRSIIRAEVTGDFYFSHAFNKRLSAHLDIDFVYYENQPFISKVSASFSKDGLTYFNELNILTQKFRDFKFSPDQYWSLNEYSAIPYISYDAEAWRKYNIPQADSFQIIAKDLLKDPNGLEAYFMKQKDGWFYSEKAEKGKNPIIAKINRLKRSF